MRSWSLNTCFSHWQNFGIKERIDDLSAVEVNLTDVDIMSEELEEQLTNLANAKLDEIDFNTFKAEVGEKEISLGEMRS